jgi:hypothetical protein
MVAFEVFYKKEELEGKVPYVIKLLILKSKNFGFCEWITKFNFGKRA